MRDTRDTQATPQLPALGYPISEHAVADWYEQTHGRQPTDREVGAIIDAMAQREATSPRVGPTSEPEGWAVGPSAHPATRR